MDKRALRKTYLEKRKALLPAELEKLNELVVGKFAELSFNNIKLVHIFYPITGKQEFNSLLLKEYLENTQPELKFVLPKSNTSNHTLTNILWEEETPLAMNQWGITEPELGIEVPSKSIDMVIIPLLAFDKQGNRIGYGKGFYDRFLADCRPDVVKAGVSYFNPEEKFDDVDVYDIPLDICVTPEKIWRFNLLGGE